MSRRNSPIHRRNFILLTVCLGAWTALIVGRLIQLQVLEHESYQRQARRQQEQIVEISPVRGVIYDRNLRPLAMSVEVESVFAVPAEITEPETTARLLARVLNLNPKELARKLSTDRSFSWVKRKVSATEADRVRQLNLKGIHFQKESKRFYPKRELAAHILGHVGVDDQGLAGIELVYDKQIRGRPGEMVMERDARRRWFGRAGRPPAPGDNLVLTLDEGIQYIAERELSAAMAASRSRAGAVIVEDPGSGEILAMASRPTFNPNAYADAPQEAMRNFALTDIYEPGSTFKIVTMAAAFEEGLATPDEEMDCQMGSINVAGHTIRDWKPFGILTVTQAFENSSDVCAIKLALRVGKEDLYRHIRAFGFGAPTGVELAGEARGLLRAPERWWKASIGAIAMGQEIGVTPLQMLAAAAAIANDGIWVRPHIVRELPSGQPEQTAAVPASLQDSSGPRGRRVVSSQTAARMQRLMESVVERGTGKLAKPRGYSAAGKTGTAQKLDPATGTYSLRDHVASFVGYFPAESPQFAMIVVMDSPRGKYHGGDLAAPIFARIAEQILAYRNIPSREPPPVSVADARGRAGAEPAREEAAATHFQPATPGLVVPDFVGQPLRSVTAKALERRLPVEIIGNGIAYEQTPPPGELLAEGERIVIRFRIGGRESQQSPPRSNFPNARPALPEAAAGNAPATG